MKRFICLAIAMAMVFAMSVDALAMETVELIQTSPTTQAFTSDPVGEDDLNAILQAGLAATSAINQQPWFFAVVTDKEIMSQISGGGASPVASTGDGEGPAAGIPAAGGATAKAALGDSPVAIIIYMSESTPSPDPSFDCGLACQNMVIAANALGYGTKIVSSPKIALNGDNHDEFCEMLGVDASLTAVAVLLVGYQDTQVDGVTSSTTRYSIEEKVSFVE